MSQEIYSGFDYIGFEWTEDAQGTWYKLGKTYKEAEKLAVLARNKRAKELTAKGYRVTKFSLGKQLLTEGGIGSGKPEISLLIGCYGLNWSQK